MLGITLRYRKRNTWIRQETGVSDVINAIRKAKQTGPDQTLMVKISQTQKPVGSIQRGVPQSRENTNPDGDHHDNDDDELCFTDFNVDLLGSLASNSLILSIICHIIASKQLNDSRIHMHSFDRKILFKVLRKKS